MEFIAHRINTREELKRIPRHYGVEIDLRDFGDRLILQHDPFLGGEDFDDFLQEYQHGTLILNIKSERIEFRVLELLQKHNVVDYFFLDSSIPMIVLLSKQGEKKIAVRLSEFESIETVLRFSEKVDWVWIDCFTTMPLTPSDYQLLKENGFRCCFVSPELQGQKDKIEPYRSFFQENNLQLDAVCAKMENDKKWRQNIEF